MLALRFRPGESVIVGDAVVKVFDLRPNTVKLGIDAPRHVPIVRSNAVRTSRPSAFAEAVDLIDAAEAHRQAITKAGNRMDELMGATGQSGIDTAFELIDGAFSREQCIRLLRQHPRFAQEVTHGEC